MKAETRAKFLRANPRCCFCGGLSLATTLDHQPGRVFFHGKRMPEGAILPACSPCQDVSRDAENLMSLLVAATNFPETEFQRWLKRHQAISRQFPAYVADLVPSDALREDLKQQVAEPPPGFTFDSMITLDADLWAPIFAVFSKKLVLAMHYQALGVPLSPEGRLLPYLVPNGHFDRGWDAQINAATLAGPTAKHGNEDLSEQITYRWAYNAEQRAFCSRLTLHQSIIIYGFTVEPPLTGDLPSELDGPFRWYLPSVTPPFVGRASGQ